MNVAYLHGFLALFFDLDRNVQKQIKKKLDELARSDAGSFQHQALKGSQFAGLYKYRVGDWRLVYKLEEDRVVFITLAHRSEVYTR